MSSRAKIRLVKWRSACQAAQAAWEELVGSVSAEAAATQEKATKRARLEEKRKTFAAAGAPELDAAADEYDA